MGWKQKALTTGAALIAVAMVAATIFASRRGQPIDPHAIYEAACAKCHEPHARSLVEAGIRSEGGSMVTARTGKDLREFLSDHRSVTLSDAQRDGLIGQFGAMMESRFIFSRKCAACHGRAVDFARAELELRGGKLYYRHDYKALDDVLRYHGDLIPAEVPVVIDMLRRNLETASD